MKEKAGKLIEGESISDGLEQVITGNQSDHHPPLLFLSQYHDTRTNTAALSSVLQPIMAAGRNNFKGWIWPSDRRPGQSWKRNRWSSFKDVLTGKGADIYIGSLDKDPHRPSRPRWSNWGHYFDGIPLDEREVLLPFGCKDRSGQVYDFRTRRYKSIAGGPRGMWSDVRRCPNKYARVPISYRDAYGIPYDLSHAHFDPFFGDETCWSKYHG